MHCKGFVCKRLLDMGSTSAEDQWLECFKQAEINIYISAMKI
jgi:hypothetical protein